MPFPTVTETAQQWMVTVGAAVAFGYGLLTPESGLVTVGLGVLAAPGMLKLVVQARNVKVQVEATG